MAALGTASLEKRTSGPGAHTPPESMLALAAAIVRLIGTFHGEVIPELGKSRHIRESHGTGTF